MRRLWRYTLSTTISPGFTKPCGSLRQWPLGCPTTFELEEIVALAK